MDIGCGDGGLTVSLLRHLRQTGKVDQIEEILLIDPSPAMASLAFSTVQAAFPETRVIAVNQRIEDFTRSLDRHYDVALSSLAYHHMPLEEKMVLLEILKPWIDHFILFELDANNDTPECVLQSSHSHFTSRTGGSLILCFPMMPRLRLQSVAWTVSSWPNSYHC